MQCFSDQRLGGSHKVDLALSNQIALSRPTDESTSVRIFAENAQRTIRATRTLGKVSVGKVERHALKFGPQLFRS